MCLVLSLGWHEKNPKMLVAHTPCSLYSTGLTVTVTESTEVLASEKFPLSVKWPFALLCRVRAVRQAPASPSNYDMKAQTVHGAQTARCTVVAQTTAQHRAVCFPEGLHGKDDPSFDFSRFLIEITVLKT